MPEDRRSGRRGGRGRPADAAGPGAPGGRDRRGSRPRSRADHNRRVFGQNFLVDSRSVQRFVEVAAPRADDLVLEVGPGEGRITRAVSRKCRRVVAYEIDGRIAGRLRESLGAGSGINVVNRDFLKSEPPREPFSVVGNIPFSSTSKIIDWCLDARSLRSATFITQLEYARKRTGDYGRWSRLTVATWPDFHWRIADRIPRHKFRPVPKVDAGVMRIERREEPLLPRSARGDYLAMVDAGFTGKGGSLHASLRRGHRTARVNAAFREARLDPDTVVAFVHPDQWVTLFRVLHNA